jgi:Zn-finger nucleic acid-binding protein
MKCPICKDPDLVMTERQNIEIDYCPQCRGVWLDRGELDKLIERATAAGIAEPAPARAAPPPNQPYQQPQPPQQPQYPQQHQFGNRYDKDDQYRQGYPHKKRKGFLGELFDFD